MKYCNDLKSQLIVLVPLLLVSMLVTAHDPKEHAKETEAPQCEALASMDQSEIDENDPVMQAVYAKCRQAMAEGHHGEGHAKDPNENKSAHTEKDAHAHEDDDLRDRG